MVLAPTFSANSPSKGNLLRVVSAHAHVPNATFPHALSERGIRRWLLPVHLAVTKGNPLLVSFLRLIIMLKFSVISSDLRST
ncbi:hypothetical protein JTE90_027747 [Oedothorax gibbosus]|uniref:Uncharacterized protein n=1 Tax=Oedothorax gibbosus TaxID=931172 RepID=A0AAV6TE56_9ARAC|nr:hypothetical protein JTE90_027747 [Oedothorax gibbosus]